VALPAGAVCKEDVLDVGFRFSWTRPEGPEKLTDFASDGISFGTVYGVVNLSDRFQIVAEFGYDNFALREGPFGSLIATALAESLAAALEEDPFFPEGSSVTVSSLAIEGGDFNAAHLTAGIRYLFANPPDNALLPYATFQAGLYSKGQSDTDVSLTLDVQRPGQADTTLVMPAIPFLRDDDRDNAVGFNFGAGVELRLSGEFSILADFRYHLAYTEERTTRFLNAGLGVAYHLGF